MTTVNRKKRNCHMVYIQVILVFGSSHSKALRPPTTSNLSETSLANQVVAGIGCVPLM